MDLQQQLANAFGNRNVKEFELALHHGANANVADERGRSLYETSLSTPGCAAFIQLCLRYGCSPVHVNKKLNKAAVNFAADSRDSGNLQALLEHPNVDSNHQYNGLTALNSLAKNANSQNAKEVMKCMEQLLAYGASPNIPDDNEMSPLHFLLQGKAISSYEKEKMVTLFLQQPTIDIDSSDGELRRKLKKRMPQMKLPPVRLDLEASIIDILREGDVQRVQQFLDQEHWYKSKLLCRVIQTYSNQDLDTLLKTDFDVNMPAEANGVTFIEIAIAYGNFYALQLLLEHPLLKLPSGQGLLVQVLSRLDEKPVNPQSDYERCFQLLLASNKVDVNEKDRDGRTPLHYASLYNLQSAVQSLLRRGAYLGARSRFGEIALKAMDVEQLQHCFDECIHANSNCRSHINYQITLDYSNLIHQHAAKHNAMDAIVALSESEKLCQILNHPLIRTFIYFKFDLMKIPFYLYFTASMVLYLVSMAFIPLYCQRQIDGLALTIMWTIYCLTLIYIETSFIIKLLSIPIGWESCKILIQIAMGFLAFFIHKGNSEIGALAIVFLGFRMTELLGSLPIFSLSMYVIMFKRVFQTFLKSFLPYSPLMISFALAFYVLNIHKLSDKYVYAAIFKTTIMSTGEFDEGNIDFQNFFSVCLFFLFVIAIPIVMMNLVSALAFSDIQAIQSLAEEHTLIGLANLLRNYEHFVSKPMFSKLSNVCALFKKSITPDSLFLYPSKNGIFKQEKMKTLFGKANYHHNNLELQCDCEVDCNLFNQILKIIDKRCKLKNFKL